MLGLGLKTNVGHGITTSLPHVDHVGAIRLRLSKNTPYCLLGVAFPPNPHLSLFLYRPHTN